MQVSSPSPQTFAQRYPLERYTTRRNAMRFALLAALSAVVAESAVATYRMLAPMETRVFGFNLLVGNVPNVRALLAKQGYLQDATGRLYLLAATDNRIIAVYWKCPFLAHHCTLPPPSSALAGDIQCPCCGSLFDGKTGNLIHGPATRPLDYFPISVEHGNVVVHTGTLLTRQHTSRDQETALY